MQLPDYEGGHKTAAIIAGLIGLTLLGAGLFVWKMDTEPEMEVIRKVDEVDEAEEDLIFVDAEGEVVRPGVYKLKSGARVADVIDAAGGFTDQADTQWVELHVNKAEQVEDGYKLYIPKLNQVVLGIVAGKDTNAIISINYASKQELEGLPGVGAVTAEKIIRGRPYNSTDDLKKEKIVTQKVFDQIEKLIGL